MQNIRHTDTICAHPSIACFFHRRVCCESYCIEYKTMLTYHQPTSAVKQYLFRQNSMQNFCPQSPRGVQNKMACLSFPPISQVSLFSYELLSLKHFNFYICFTGTRRKFFYMDHFFVWRKLF